jgi:hypothetical protein
MAKANRSRAKKVGKRDAFGQTKAERESAIRAMARITGVKVSEARASLTARQAEILAARAPNTKPKPVLIQGAEYLDYLRHVAEVGMRLQLRTAIDHDGWKLSEADYQKLVNLKAQLLAVVAGATPIRIAAPVLKLVVG